MNEQGRPNTWRDTYDLVRDSREDVLDAVAKLDLKLEGYISRSTAKHEALVARVTDIEVARAKSSGQQAGEARVFGFARSSLALVISAISGAAALIAILGR